MDPDAIELSDGYEPPPADLEVTSAIPMAIEAPVEESVEMEPSILSAAMEDMIELGDYVVIESTSYGRITGTVVYRSLERISIQPTGISNYIQHLTVHQPDDEQGEVFDDADGIQAVFIIEKRKATTFVEQHNLRVGQTIDTFDADREPSTTYEVIAVDEETDAITLRDPNDPEQPLEVVFGGVGLELDAPFAVLRVRPVMLEEQKAQSVDEEAAVAVEAEADEADVEAVEAVEAEEFEVVGVVEIAQAKIFREAAAYEQRIPDDLQKIDALNDFLAGLNPSVQKDPRAIRSIRILVESLFHLKQETVQYRSDGSIEGPKAMTVSTLQELIQRSPLALGRPVLSVSKRLYHYQTSKEREMGEAAEPIEEEGIYYVDQKDEMIAQGTKSAAVSKSDIGGSIREWRDQQENVRRFQSPWKSAAGSEGSSVDRWTALSDGEFFRVPTYDSDLSDVVGFLPSHHSNTAPTLDVVPFSIERALTTTYRKGDGVRGKLVAQKKELHPAESAPLSGYLLFPLSVLSYGLGATRTGLLAYDSSRSHLPRRLMSDIMKRFDPDTTTDATELLLLKSDHYDVIEYVDSMPMPSALGIGDTMSLLTHYGLDTFELTEDLHEVLQKKVDAAQAQLISALASLRALLDGIEEPHAAEAAARLPGFFATLRKQPMLLTLMEEFERTHPNVMQTSMAAIGLLAYLLRHASNYTQVAAGENPLEVAHAFQQAGLSEYLRHVRIAQQVRLAQTTIVERPMKNTCEHVAALVSIRRIVDDGERFLQLTLFFKRFQGPRDHNWINCTICKKQLLCMHERLQIQAFLNAKEKSTIEKQIILGFSGGVFQGKYICRNCGQPIRDLDFDNNIEFDDDGKPKSGRAVLVDQDALFEEHLDQLISAPVSAKEGGSAAAAVYMLKDEERKVYHVARELAERIGVTIEFEGYRRIIEDTHQFMNTLPTREEYGTRMVVAYEVFVARLFVTATAAFVLLEIQSHVPVYMVRFTIMGCPDPGFDGWPLSADRTALQGVRYMACAVSSTTRKDSPWGEAGFAKITDDAKRMAGIAKYIENVLDKTVFRADVQVRLSMKRRYVLDVLGRSVEGDSVTFSKERVMPTFLPEMVVLSPSDAAKDVITPEVMEQMGQKGQYALSKLWIRQSHVAARQTAILVRGSPFAETTCCTAKLSDPVALGAKKLEAAKREEVDGVTFPELAARALHPTKQGSFLLTDFHPRAADDAVVEPNAELYYRIFLKCCFTGPRVGHLHEPGLTHRCIWCGFQFPSHPAVMNADTEGKAALADVETSTEAFTRLLDTIHRVNQVPSIATRTITPLDTLMKEFGAVHPAPFPEWQEILRVTIEQCKKLAPTAQKDEIAQAIGQLSRLAGEFEHTVNQGRRFTEAHRGVMSMIVDLPWSNFFSVVQTYFVVPMKRLLTQFNPKVLQVPKELADDLSHTHVDADIKPFLDAEVAYVTRFESLGVDEQMKLARVKIEYFVEQWTALMPFAQRVRPIAVPGRERMLSYVKRALWYGILSVLLDSGMNPVHMKTSVMASVNDPSARQILEVMGTLIKKFNIEKLSYNDKEIKDMIAVRDEKERVSVVKTFDRMTEEERAVELMNKQYGIGKWAVGGTKLIYAYDKDYYDQEREKRIAAGNMDLSFQPEMPEGRDADEWGFPVHAEEEVGYDMELNPHAQEDE